MRKAGTLLFCIALLSGFLLSCNKEKVLVTAFSTYTSTDNNCNIIGTTDSTDWTKDTIWTTTELSYIKFIDTNVVIKDSVAGAVSIGPACPNPSTGIFTLPLQTERQCKLKLACINTDMQVVYYKLQSLPGGAQPITLDFTQLTSFHRNSYYRLYYAFYTSKDSLYYKGHGDFRIE